MSQRNACFCMGAPSKIITLLCRASRTVEELAQALDLTVNDIRTAGS